MKVQVKKNKSKTYKSSSKETKIKESFSQYSSNEITKEDNDDLNDLSIGPDVFISLYHTNQFIDYMTSPKTNGDRIGDLVRCDSVNCFNEDMEVYENFIKPKFCISYKKIV